MVFRVLSVAVMAAGLLGFAGEALAKPHKISRQIPVDEEFGDFKMNWLGEPSSYIYRMRIIAPNGIIELCGAGVITNAQFRNASIDVLRSYSLELNGKPILSDFTFFTKVRSRRKLDSALANCVSSGVRVPKGDIEFGIGTNEKKIYRID